MYIYIYIYIIHISMCIYIYISFMFVLLLVAICLFNERGEGREDASGSRPRPPVAGRRTRARGDSEARGAARRGMQQMGISCSNTFLFILCNYHTLCVIPVVVSLFKHMLS